MKKYIVNRVWTTTAGLQACVIYKRHYCGYVAVSDLSPLYLMNHYNFLERAIQVHGGLTYSTALPTRVSDYENQTYPIKSDTFTWWFGFDCGHYDDYNIRQKYCEDECEFLAKQLVNIEQKLTTLL